MSERTPLLTAAGAPSLELVKVARDVYTYAPQQLDAGANGDSESEPQLVIVFGWRTSGVDKLRLELIFVAVEGRLSSLTKYMQGYSRLYPQAKLVLVLARKSSGWSRKSTNLEAVRPAAELIQGYGMFGSTPPNTLVHVLSNGGGFQLILVSELLNAIPRGPSPSTRPTTAIVFDSAPGEAGLGHALRAHTIGLSWFIKLLVSGPLILIYAAVMGSAFLLGRPSPFTVLRNGLQQPELIPFADKRTPRLYIYSKEDQIVQAASVEEHVAEARELGLSTDVEVFHGSSHVAHLRADPVRYWDVITKHWSRAVKAMS
ncbi:hypothetical protein K438DRAFT_1943420 [Mycena galopus ATCC 62051]|nr:hypothetical protein K438DRAFT_1943420 [Mycena galopus ATCC 62051]